jgi:hypothetical protein
LRRYETVGDSFLKLIVTEDESWVHYYQFDMKRASRSPIPLFPPKISAHRNLWEKVMLALFWDHQGPLVEHYNPRGSQSPVLHTASEGRHQIKTSWSTQYWYLNAE